MPFLFTGGRPGRGYDLPLTYFHARSSSPVQSLHQRRVGFPTARFCRSPACVGNSLGYFTLIRKGVSHVVLVRSPPVCRRHRSWVDPNDTYFFCGFPLGLKRPGRKLDDDSVSVGLPCHHGRDVHPLCLLLRCVVVATGERDPQSCIEARPYDQLLTPAAVADFHALRYQPSATVGAIL